jgi:replicative DNA helicase Mcm
MNREDIIEGFAEFLRDYYYAELAKALNEGKKSIEIDFSKLDKFSPELGDLLLENPEETLDLAEEGLKQIDLPQSPKDFRLRFFNLPKSREIRIRNLRAEHIGKFVVVDGIVKRASEVRPEISEAIFECPECGNRITVIQTERAIKKPRMCDCGARRGFRLVNQKLYDARWIVVEEPFEITSGERPSVLTIYLKEDLTTPRLQSKTDPGNRIKVVGILKQIPRVSKREKTRQLEIYLDANYVESVETEWEELIISPEDEKRIKKLSKDPKLFEKLIQSLAPTMYGMEDIKEAIILQLFGGEDHILKDGTKIRGNIHILLVGDPASGKSRIMQLASKLIPRGKYVSGRGVTGAGLTATVVRDEQFLGGWVLEAGALVMANRSLCAIDEFSKVSPQDQVALQEAMSLGTISIAKASIVATLPAMTSILAGGNPKLGRFDPYIPIREQIDISDVLLSRFDLRFALRDVPNPEVDGKMVDHILRMRHFEEEEAKPLIEPEFLRKYIAYARAKIHPTLTKEAANRIKEFYLQMRSKAAGGEAPVPITLRQYEAMIRLAEASAKIRLSKKVTVEDAERAIRLMKVSLRQFGFDPEIGMFDIDRAEGAIPSTQRSKIRIVLDVIEDLIKTLGKTIPEAEIIKQAKDQGVDDVEDILKKMKSEGIIFSPKPGYVQKI